jgi:transposase
MNNPSARARKKLLAIYLKSIGFDHGTICNVGRISEPTLVTYLKAYRDGCIERLSKNPHLGHPSELNKYRQEITEAFHAKLPASLKEAREKIKKVTGLERSLPQIWCFLGKIGLRPRKVGGVPGKVNIEAQEAFKKKNLNRGLRKPRQESG